MPVCLQIMHALKMHKGVNASYMEVAKKGYEGLLTQFIEVMVCARQRGILDIRKFV